MTAARRDSPYDALAWFYDKEWGPSRAQLLSFLDPLMLQRLPGNARILDLCCGTGQLVELLIARGYRVSGLDASEEMVRLARLNVPAANLIHADARETSAHRRRTMG